MIRFQALPEERCVRVVQVQGRLVSTLDRMCRKRHCRVHILGTFGATNPQKRSVHILRRAWSMMRDSTASAEHRTM